MSGQDSDRLIGQLLLELSHGDRKLLDSLSPNEKELAISLLEEIRANQSMPMLDTIWELDYVRRPVDVMTFLTSPDYLGMDIIRNADDEARTSGVFETWANTLIELFRPDKSYWEMILSSSIGTGKTSAAVLALVYKMYRLSCLRNPQKFYGLLPGHAIVFGVYNIFKYKAQSVAVDYFRKAIEASPYFQHVFPLGNKKSDLEFPNSISVGCGASGLSAIGQNIFSVLIDETDFMKAAAAGQSQRDVDHEKGQAQELYNSTLRRMESRFMRGGNIPGIMIQISSKATADSYLAERIKSRGNADNVLVVEKTGWEVKPWRYTGQTFWLYVGDTTNDPRILTNDEHAALPDKSQTMQVPEEHRMAFTEDIHGALRDLANVATSSESPLIPRKDRILECVDASRKHPFTKVEFHVGLEDEEAIEDYLILDDLLTITQGRFVPKVRPTVPRYIHFDLGISGDALGFAMGHVSKFDIVKKVDRNTGHEFEVKIPHAYIDLMLRVIPVKGSKIRISAVRDFIFALRSYGFPIAKVTADTFQSTDILQQLIRAGFQAEVLSLDVAKEKTGHPYAFLREAIMERRASYYHYPQFIAEAGNLQRFDIVSQAKVKWKVDHPQKMRDLDGNPVKGAKDVSDSVGGVVYHCMVQPPDVDPPPVTPAQAMMSVKSASQTKNRFIQSSQHWAVGDDYRP